MAQKDLLNYMSGVDHITHNPVGINVNDVRNLRWCNHKENMNFEEAYMNKSVALKGNKNAFGSDFGQKFYEKYGIYASDDIKLYKKEHNWYYNHNKKCSWEYPYIE